MLGDSLVVREAKEKALRRKINRMYASVICLYALLIAGGIGFWGAIAWVIVHFARKYW